MKIFVTGGKGFIGSHLVPRLTVDHQIACLECDLLDFAQVDRELTDFSPNVIVHLAAKTEVEHSFYEQTAFSQVNYVGSVNLMESAQKLPSLQRFIFASTMEVFGWQPISDEIRLHGHVDRYEVFDQHTAANPNAPYAVAKYGAEKYLEYMGRSQGLPYVSVRQTNSYGRSNTDFFVMEQIISQMLHNAAVCNLGDSTPYRNFIFIDDLVDAWVSIINSAQDRDTPSMLTVGPNNAIQIKQLAEMVAQKLQWQGEILWDQKRKRPGEIYWLNSDHTIITELTGWRPTVDLDHGVDRTINIWRNLTKQTRP